MKSFTARRNLFGKYTIDTSSSNLTFGDETMNDEARRICSMRDWPFLHRLRTMLTVASTQFGSLPYDIEQVESVFVTVSNQRYTPKLITSREQWDILNRTAYTSDFPEFAYVYDGELGLWPTPASSANVISVNGKVRIIDLNTADDTSRTITTLANGSTALTVSGGLTAQMVGFWIRPTFSTTANTGDGHWYEIAGVTNATTGTLERKYGGVSIAVGTAACTIAQIHPLPEAFQDLPIFKAAETYWDVNNNPKKTAIFSQKYKEGIAALMEQYGSPITDVVIDDGEGRGIINPNLVISL